MKKTSLFLSMAGFLLMAGIFFSCTKDPTLTDADELSLKSAPITVALTPMEQLGKHLYFDKISSPNSMACADCHAASVGFTGPVVGFNIHGSVYRGADAQNFGDRKPPSAAYATFAEVLHRDEDGTFEGGMFWDGRATGETLGSPAAEQALGPFLNPAEHNLKSKLEVLQKIAKSNYISMWKEAFPNDFSLEDADVDKIYDQVGLAIAAYEGSGEVNQFSSKFDYVMKGQAEFTEQEAWGLELFEGKGKCAECHPTTFDDDVVLFTDYTYDNLGVPKNPENPVYKYNPGFIDKGLGGFLATTDKWKMYADENMGKQKVPTLRNVDKRPGLGFTKAYTHNGYFKSLKEVVHFYNTRDVPGAMWPPAEYPENINTDELGNLGLTDAEEDAIVAFMATLSDGYQVKLKK
ncbi:MAG TPA: cytochrome c peroxidase [Prolixibacteraceae bacterium]|nr:cytochrome c peroxidase [Prolixibacteraceae bacterium]